MRRCTGFSPSRTSGSARETRTILAYSRYERLISSGMEMGRMSLGSLPPGVWSSVLSATFWGSAEGVRWNGDARQRRAFEGQIDLFHFTPKWLRGGMHRTPFAH